MLSSLKLDGEIDLKKEKTLNTLLKENVKILSGDQIKSLMELTHKNEPILSLENSPDFAYEVIGLLNVAGFTETFKILNDAVNSGMDFDSQIIFNSKVFDKERDIYESDISKIRDKIKLKNGLPCRHCKDTNTVTYSKQTRSGDEGETQETICYTCGHKSRS